MTLTAKVLASRVRRVRISGILLSFPAIMPSGNPLWPEYWSLMS